MNDYFYEYSNNPNCSRSHLYVSDFISLMRDIQLSMLDVENCFQIGLKALRSEKNIELGESRNSNCLENAEWCYGESESILSCHDEELNDSTSGIEQNLSVGRIKIVQNQSENAAKENRQVSVIRAPSILTSPLDMARNHTDRDLSTHTTLNLQTLNEMTKNERVGEMFILNDVNNSKSSDRTVKDKEANLEASPMVSNEIESTYVSGETNQNESLEHYSEEQRNAMLDKKSFCKPPEDNITFVTNQKITLPEPDIENDVLAVTTNIAPSNFNNDSVVNLSSNIAYTSNQKISDDETGGLETFVSHNYGEMTQSFRSNKKKEKTPSKSEESSVVASHESNGLSHLDGESKLRMNDVEMIRSGSQFMKDFVNDTTNIDGNLSDIVNQDEEKEEINKYRSGSLSSGSKKYSLRPRAQKRMEENEEGREELKMKKRRRLSGEKSFDDLPISESSSQSTLKDQEQSENLSLSSENFDEGVVIASTLVNGSVQKNSSGHSQELNHEILNNDNDKVDNKLHFMKGQRLYTNDPVASVSYHELPSLLQYLPEGEPRAIGEKYKILVTEEADSQSTRKSVITAKTKHKENCKKLIFTDANRQESVPTNQNENTKEQTVPGVVEETHASAKKTVSSSSKICFLSDLQCPQPEENANLPDANANLPDANAKNIDHLDDFFIREESGFSSSRPSGSLSCHYCRPAQFFRPTRLVKHHKLHVARGHTPHVFRNLGRRPCALQCQENVGHESSTDHNYLAAEYTGADRDPGRCSRVCPYSLNSASHLRNHYKNIHNKVISVPDSPDRERNPRRGSRTATATVPESRVKETYSIGESVFADHLIASGHNFNEGPEVLLRRKKKTYFHCTREYRNYPSSEQ